MPHPRRKPPNRALLVLENHELGRELQKAAVKLCVRLGAQLDILLVTPPGAVSTLPALLLMQLEHSGMDYRLAQVNGTLSDQVERYLQRLSQAITLILPDKAALSTRCREAMLAKGHPVVRLSATDSACRARQVTAAPTLPLSKMRLP